MSKPKLLVDMDGTWYNWHIALFNELFIHDKVTCDYYTFWKVEYKKYSSMFWENMIRVPFLYSTQIPNKQTLDTFAKLDECFEIYHVTARPKEMRDVTENYLERYNIPQRKNLYFESRKGLFANSIGITIGIEDQCHHLKDLIANGVNVVAVRQPYNEEEVITLGCPVVDTFSQVENFLL
jgi:uncharacterized HAD superfamily protein